MAMAATSCARSFLRSSTSLRNAASKFAFETKAARSPSPFRITKQGVFRSPVELSCCVDSLMPFHTATASALLTSMLSVSRPGYGWLPQACNDDV